MMADEHLGHFRCLGTHKLNSTEKLCQHHFANGSIDQVQDYLSEQMVRATCYISYDITQIIRGAFHTAVLVGRLFVKRFALSLWAVLSVCNVGILWPNGWMDQDATWNGSRPSAQAKLY